MGSTRLVSAAHFLSRNFSHADMLESELKRAILSSVSHKEFRDILEYAVLPAGKLFRPRLVEAMALDLDKNFSRDHLHLACALEIHHAYTLVHDDLPAMDNDLIRRGKPSTHAKFGEWQAILAGDALLINSFEELMKINSPKIRELHRLFSWCTGGKGLILGQYLDLKSEGKVTTSEILRIHELKTARLIQVAIAGAAMISQKKFSRSFFRLGREIGITFQLLDDLNELTAESLSAHEKEINPFLLNPSQAISALQASFTRLEVLLRKEKLTHVNAMLESFFAGNRKELSQKSSVIFSHIGVDLQIELKGFL